MPSILDQLLGNGDMQQQPNVAQQILSARFQPSQDDVAQSIFRNTTGFNGSASYSPVSPQQISGQNQMAQIQPYDMALQAQGRQIQNNIQQQTGLPMAQADLQKQLMANDIQQQTGLPLAQAQLQSAQTANQYQPQSLQADIANKNAMAGYYGNSLQRDLAEKAFSYANDPQMAQSRMMAQYMQSLSGQGQSAPSGGTAPQVNASDLQPGAGAVQSGGAIPAPPTPVNLSQALQQNAQPNAQQGGGFNPMGAMLAKSLGLTDMQIGPNGQPMPIPGSMKIENGSVISFDANGKPQANIPVNPRAQGLFEQKLQDIAGNVNKLHDLGDTIEEGRGFLPNMMNEAEGSSYTGLPTILQGTQGQTLRDNIQADVKQALPLYMQAFGITPGMERAQAAQQMLQDAIGGSLTKSRQHTMANLKNLSQTAGTGELAKQLSRVNVISPDGQQGTIAPEEMQAALANGWKQVQ